MAWARKKEVDYDIGKKLPAFFRQCHLKDIAEQTSQPVMTAPDEKVISEMLAYEMTPLYVDAQLTSEEEMARLIRNLHEEVTKDPGVISRQCLMHQVVGFKS